MTLNRYFFTKLLKCLTNLLCTDDGSRWLQASPTEFFSKLYQCDFIVSIQGRESCQTRHGFSHGSGFQVHDVTCFNTKRKLAKNTGRWQKSTHYRPFSHTIPHLFPFVPQRNIVSHGFCSAKLPSFLCILVTSDPPRCPTEPYYAIFLLTTSSDSFGPERGLLRPVFAFARVAMESVFAHAQKSSNRSYFNKRDGENKKRIQQNEKISIHFL